MAREKLGETGRFTIRFGGGVNSTSSADQIEDIECASGQNFEFTGLVNQFKPRAPFDLIGTVPNESEIRGFASLLKTDGTVSMLVQAGDTVYEWDGLTTFTSVGTVSSTAKLRGRIEHNWQLDDKVFITDLNLQENVLEWDGTTLQDMTEDLTGDFKAKYCFVDKERVWFANVESNSVATPNLFLASGVSDNTDLTVTDRPSSSLSEGDPFYLISPDLKPINGFINAFGKTFVSTEKGEFFVVNGESAKNFAVERLSAKVNATGAEAVTFVGNDILYGRQGRIESVLATDKFGDTEANDVSIKINNDINTYNEWNSVFNSRTQQAVFIPVGESQAWIFNKTLMGASVSPWVKYTTVHPSAFNPTAIMNCYDPQNGLEYIFFGDSSGNLYKLEGTRGNGDAGTTDIVSNRLSKSFRLPGYASMYDFEGSIRYKKEGASVPVTVTLNFSGDSVSDNATSITLPAAASNYYGGAKYYSNGDYYGRSFSGRIFRQKLSGMAGSSDEVQVTLSADTSNDFTIEEVELTFSAAG